MKGVAIFVYVYLNHVAFDICSKFICPSSGFIQTSRIDLPDTENRYFNFFENGCG